MTGLPSRERTEGGVLRKLDLALGLLHTAFPSVLLVTAFVVISYAVIVRHFFQGSFATANEIAQLCAVWLVMLGAARAVRKDTMIVVGLVPGAVEKRIERPLRWPRLVIYLVVLVAITWPSAVMLTKTTQHYDALAISKGWGVAAMPIGFALMTVVLIVRSVSERRVVR